MFGGPSKLGRGGGAGRGVDGGPKRFHSTSQPIRPPGPPHGRLSMPGPRNRTPAPPAAPPAVEETFSLVSGKNPLAFAMIIRLAPDLIDEIRRVEAQGGAARMKFDANPNNSTGNVIDVGGKEFRFTWSKEFGDLCDIYEERQNGEDGNGLLVESGSAWRKLNVQRVLDESTTNHVKMRSVEAERKKEQRKTIILDNGNPSTKKQVPPSEANPWRTGFKKKEPPPKKRKVDTPLVPSGSAVKPTQKSGSTPSSSKPVGKGPCSVSPLPSPQDPLQAVASPLSGLNILRSTEEIIVPTQLRKEDSDRDVSIKSSGLQDKSGSKLELGAKPPTDLQSMITSLLKENPKGMSLKALEKAIGDTFPSSGKKIEPILKRIAVYQAPGRYLLKPEPEAEGTKGPSPGRNSPFDYSNIQIPTSASEPTFDKEVRQEEGLAELNTTEFDNSENIDIEQHSPDILGDKKDSVRDSSSDSGSSSDSDSSDSGSDSPSGSRSRSKSRSPSRSGGSSDSESADSSSKEGSDEEVDIISDDDKPKPSQDPVPVAPSPIPNGNDSDIVDIDGDVNEEHPDSVRGGGSPNQDDQNLIGSLFGEDSAFGGPDPMLRGESKRGTDIQNEDVGPGHVKRSRVENASAPATHGRYSSSPHEPTPDWSREMTKPPLNQTVPGKFSNLPPQQQMQRLSGHQPTSYDSSWRISKHGGPGESFGQVGAFSDKSHNADLGRSGESFSQVGAFSDKSHNADLVRSSKGTPESYGSRPSRGGPSGRHSLPFELHKNLGPTFKESPRVNGRGPVLQREVSDLELGELREPIPEEGPTKKTFERRGSFNDTRPKPPPKSENFPRQRTLEQRDDEAAIPQIPSRPTNINGTAPVSKISEVKFKRNGILAVPGILSDKDGPPKIDNRTAVAPHQTKKETRTQVVVANGGKKRKESSSDENSCPYLKYEKDEPELKGRIRDLTQYNEYVQEFSEKYESYCSLNKVLESYRQDFLNLGRELDSARGGRDTDRYNKVESQIRESYRKCGMKHKRLKKIFTVLHEELKHLKRMLRDYTQVNSKD